MNTEPKTTTTDTTNAPNENVSIVPAKRKRNVKSAITRPKQKFDMVEIWWDDAAGLPAGWDDKSPKIEHQLCLSVGFVIAETPEHIVIAMDLDAAGNHNGRSQIPIGMIKHRKVLRKASR